MEPTYEPGTLGPDHDKPRSLAHTLEYTTGVGRNDPPAIARDDDGGPVMDSYLAAHVRAAAEQLDAKMPAGDSVNSPSHYAGSVEAIDTIKDALSPAGFLYFCRGNVLKYTLRAGRKGSYREDMAKAAWYARMAAGDDPREDRP